MLELTSTASTSRGSEDSGTHLKVVLPHLAEAPAVQVEHASAAAHGDVVPAGVEGRQVDRHRAEALLDLCRDGVEEVVQGAELPERNRCCCGRHGQGAQRQSSGRTRSGDLASGETWGLENKAWSFFHCPVVPKGSHL